jgi:hypothetical protein
MNHDFDSSWVCYYCGGLSEKVGEGRCKGREQMTPGTPITSISFQREWSSCAGRVSAYKACILIVEKMAGEDFIRRMDKEANRLRECVAVLRQELKAEESRLNGYIEEDRKQRAEVK